MIAPLEWHPSTTYPDNNSGKDQHDSFSSVLRTRHETVHGTEVILLYGPVAYICPLLSVVISRTIAHVQQSLISQTCCHPRSGNRNLTDTLCVCEATVLCISACAKCPIHDLQLRWRKRCPRDVLILEGEAGASLSSQTVAVRKGSRSSPPPSSWVDFLNRCDRMIQKYKSSNVADH